MFSDGDPLFPHALVTFPSIVFDSFDTFSFSFPFFLRLRHLSNSLAFSLSSLSFSDDMQWADVASCHLIAHLLRDLHFRVKILCTTRPLDESAPFSSLLRDNVIGSSVTQYDVDCISEDSIEEYLRASVSGGFGTSMDVQGLSRLVMAKTNGNPFYVKQVSVCVCACVRVCVFVFEV